MYSKEEAKVKITKLIEKFGEGLTLDGRKRVLEDNQKLSSSHLIQKSDPEAFTKEFLIEPIIENLQLEKLPEKHFRGIKEELRKVDYVLKNNDISFLAEAKPLNADLFEKGIGGGVNQIKGLFRLVEVRDNYKFGIATDGITWVFIDKNAKVTFTLNLEKDYEKIKELLMGKQEVSSEKIEEELSKKFYGWYNALLHGGEYKDHKNKLRKISAKDCLVENILSVSDKNDREKIAQTTMDRLIFIKFLQSKKIITTDILQYLLSLNENIVNEKLKQLFFQILNTKKEARIDAEEKFKNIPYLNGGLFVRTAEEQKNLDYKIKAFILKEVIKFLDSFKFFSEKTEAHGSLDPQLLGYIFEKAMTAKDRKGTGAYYTSKNITRYISENAIYPIVVQRVNEILEKKGYKKSELLRNITQVYRLKETTLEDIFADVLIKLKICDNACGSGAFLLAAAESLLEIYRRINELSRLNNTEINLRKLILLNNLYGVDKNTNAIEIAKLRLWLWLVEAYEPEYIEPLPNIDYNIRVGNSLIGYVDISKFNDRKIGLMDWIEDKKTFSLLLSERAKKKSEYQTAVNMESRKLKKEINDIDALIKKLLDAELYRELLQSNKKMLLPNREEFEKMKMFHWGFEFSNVFSNEKRGFDVIIGNPPYGNLLEDVEKNFISQFKTKNAKEIAANFIERSIQTTKEDGSIGLIVANSIAINQSTASARELIRNSMSHSTMALFGTRPAKLFADAEIRVLIFIGVKDDLKKEGVIYSTDAIKFTTKQKNTLFDNLSFESTEGLILGKERIGDGLDDNSLPKIGNKTIRNILLKLKENSKIVIKDRINKNKSKEEMEFRKTGGYWLNALEKMPYTSTKIEKLTFETKVERDFVIILINSSLFYLYWSTYGNLRDFPVSLLEKFPFPQIQELNKNKKEITKLKEVLSRGLLKCFIAGRGRVGEFRTALCRQEIDKIDEFLGKIYGLSKEEIKFTQNYDKHVRK